MSVTTLPQTCCLCGDSADEYVEVVNKRVMCSTCAGNWRTCCIECGNIMTLGDHDGRTSAWCRSCRTEKPRSPRWEAYPSSETTPAPRCRPTPSPSPRVNTMETKDLITSTLANLKRGATIGAAGEATLLCIEMAESIIGKSLPVPDVLSASPALSDVAREVAGVAIMRAAAAALGKGESAKITKIADLAEIDIGVRAMHALGPMVRGKLSTFLDRADAIIDDTESANA